MALRTTRANAAARAGEPRKVLVTGGSSGIGAATAREFAARGCRVAVTGRDRVALNEVAGGTGGVSIAGDLREPGRSRLIVDAAAEALDGLDVVVSNAGAGWSGHFAAMTGEEIDDLLDVNLRASAHVAHAALPHLRPGAGTWSSSGRSPAWSACRGRPGTRRPRRGSPRSPTSCGSS
ncbi:MAG TPA: SDR family oxidoreductase [Streptosporangiaceae bacterium]|nr:SDR family oxidoreductase [Streptosporangiaceae bacterium]